MGKEWDQIKKKYKGYDDSMFNKHLRASGIYPKNEINNYTGMYRFGKINPYSTVNKCFEVAFFTKPDLHILDKKGKSFELNPELSNNPFFIELRDKYPNIIYELQKSASNNPFSNLLFNAKNRNSIL